MPRLLPLLTCLLCLLGCGYAASVPKLPAASGTPTALPPPPPALLSNPLYVPPVDREFLWNQIVDTVDDYFRIERERRIQEIGGVLTDGQIDTYPTIGSTLLEPWREDSTPGYEKLHATLQTIRRQAIVTVQADQQGYFVQVIVEKQLEAVDRPEHSSVGTSTFRHDNSLVSRRRQRENRKCTAGGARTLGWVPLGRDASLEQQILAKIRARVADFRPS